MSKQKKEKNQAVAKTFRSNIILFEQYIQLFAAPILLLLILLIIHLVGDMYERKIQQVDVSAFTTMLPVHSYPVLKNFYQPAISAESAIILDNSSKGVLFEKNPTFRFSMASTTKIMTALTALEAFEPGEILTVKRSFVEGTALGLSLGEQMTFESLLYAMLLPSANDAAYAIADNYPGGEKAFVERMNQKTKEYLLSDTHYGDPAGLNDDQDYTTVKDLARVTSQALTQPLLVKIVQTKSFMVQNVAGKEYLLTNLNELLTVNGVTGFKTGMTTGAGGVLVTTMIKDERVYIIVVMRSEDRFLDTRSLMQLIDNNVTYYQPVFTTK